MEDRIITFRSPHLVLAGLGVSNWLGQEAGAVGARKALVVTDKGVMETGTGKNIKGLLEKEAICTEFFDQVSSDPDVPNAENCLELAKQDKFDLIVGLGGGSPMDIASVTSVLLTNPGTVYDYFGVNMVKNVGIPTILFRQLQEQARK